MSDEQTPYAEAVALQGAGATTDAIGVRLKSRGLDDEAIALLLNAVGARAADAPPPKAERNQSPEASVDAGPALPQALGTCTRCGLFLTPQNYQAILGKPYCTTCGARPEVNYPRAYRDRFWGKRDAYAWFFGFVALIALTSGAFTLTRAPLLGVGLVLSGIGYLLFWTGARMGRPSLIIVTVVGVLLSLVQGQPPNLVAIAFVVFALRSARTKLFFEMEVSEAELAEAWLAQHDNLPAQWARGLAIVAVMSPLAWLGWTTSAQGIQEFAWATATLAFGGAAIGVGAVGLRRVAPDATPPVGRKNAALFGIIGGAVAVLTGLVMLALRHFPSR